MSRGNSVANASTERVRACMRSPSTSTATVLGMVISPAASWRAPSAWTTTVRGWSAIRSRMAWKSPEAASRPPTRTRIWVASRSTSPRMWLDTSTVTPVWPSARTSSMKRAR